MTTFTNLRNPVICVVGPTASGKSDLAQALAETLDGEVVSADSMQIYRGMDIGTGKLSNADRRVPHYGLDILDPGEPYSAALFQAYAREAIFAIDSHGHQPILCGGTGFYVRAAIDDYSFPPGEQVGNPVRDRYKALGDELGAHGLWEALAKEDPLSAASIHENDTKRVIRAFELLAEGKSYASQKEALASLSEALPSTWLGISVDPEKLRQRIDARVDAMVEAGLVAEVENLLNQGFREGLTAPAAIGYKEIVAYLDGEDTLDDAIEKIKYSTHRYAKRQRTWFRKEKRITWLDGDSGNIDTLLEEALTKIARMK